METVSIIIPTFGDPKWRETALRAIHSADAQTHHCNVLPVYKDTLQTARNFGSICTEDDWLIFLDADDALDPRYVEAMLAGSGDLRWPSTIGVYADGSTDYAAILLEPKGSLLVHNWMVIGTMIRREMFMDVGGFRDLPILEDWDLWIRCVLAGAKPEPCPEAIYRVHVDPDGLSRNQQADLHGHVYTEIQQRYQADWNLKGLS